MKVKVLGAVVIACMLLAVPAMAQDSVFEQASNWISGWGKCSDTSASTQAPAKATSSKCMQSKPVCGDKMDVLGNKVPTMTME